MMVMAVRRVGGCLPVPAPLSGNVVAVAGRLVGHGRWVRRIGALDNVVMVVLLGHSGFSLSSSGAPWTTPRRD